MPRSAAVTGRRRRRATGGSAPASPGGSSLPRQRDRRRARVVVVVVSTADAVNAVLAGARTAADSGEPLAPVMFADPDQSLRSNMVAIDQALTVARTAFPRLEVMVHLGLTDAPGWQRVLPGEVTHVSVTPEVASRWATREDEPPLTVAEESR